MRVKLFLVGLLTFFAIVGAAQAGPRDPGGGGNSFNPPSSEVVCDRACFDAIFNQGGVAGPVDASPDNASSVCRDHGGLLKVSYVPGYSFLGDSVIVTVVECIDGTTHEIGGTPKKDVNDPVDPTEPGDSGPVKGPVIYIQCPGIDDPAYDPNYEPCW